MKSKEDPVFDRVLDQRIKQGQTESNEPPVGHGDVTNPLELTARERALKLLETLGKNNPEAYQKAIEALKNAQSDEDIRNAIRQFQDDILSGK